MTLQFSLLSYLSFLVSFHFIPSLCSSLKSNSFSFSLKILIPPLMATNLFKSIYHHTSPCRRHSSTDSFPTADANICFFLKPTTTTTLSRATTFPISSVTYSTPTTDPSTSQNISFDLLQQHLSDQNFRQADEETRRLLIVLAGESAQKRGYVFFSEVQFIPESDLKTIDELWRKYSDNKFGYSVQKKIWKKVNKDFTKFFIKVVWMKKLETEVEQYNYRSFPTEFMWDMDENVVEGHLPLTNALRGTQLLNCILNHKAFEDEENEEEEEEEEEERLSSKPLGRTFKTSYSF
ncbi:tetrapyrrole-binding protein, chloroplastic-like [Primulina eburnea]|uniref:tetrapyrrole-binding protein, chloroplastic-like n=1 Tax=Primulina eburnea TaxID=1245227 RepID=UPI003C6BE579